MSKANDNKWMFAEAQLDLIPELRYFADGQAPIEDVQVYLRFQQGWPMVLTLAVCGSTSLVLFQLFRTVWGLSMPIGLALLVVVQMVISWLMLGLIIPRIRRRQIRAALRKRLGELGIKTCAACAYNLRGSPERCPECGTVA